MSALDSAWAAAEAGDETARRRFYALLAEAALCVAVEGEAEDKPLIFETSQGRLAMAFDDDARLAAFFGRPAAFAALRGAALAELLAEAGIGLMLNPDSDGAALGSEALRFVAEEAAQGAINARDVAQARLTPPLGASPALLAALRARLAESPALVRSGWLVGVEGGGLVALLDLAPAARRGAESLCGGLARMAAPYAPQGLEVAAPAEGHAWLAAAQRVGVALTMPAPDKRKGPPILR